MDQVPLPASWVLAEIVLCSILLEETCSVAIDAMGEGEKQIYLLSLQDFVLKS